MTKAKLNDSESTLKTTETMFRRPKMANEALIYLSGTDSHKDAHSSSDEDSESEEPAVYRNAPAAESEGKEKR